MSRAIIAAAMCSVDPRDPPPHLTLAGSFFIASTTSFMDLNGEFSGSTKTLYSVVRRAIGVACVIDTGGLPVIRPPSITAPITISAFGSPLLALTNCASPIAPAAPPLFSYVTEEARPASWIALPIARPVVSQPPPGLAGTIIFRLPAARAVNGSAPMAASAAIDFRKVSRRMILSPLNGLSGRHRRVRACQSAVVRPRECPEPPLR